MALLRRASSQAPRRRVHRRCLASSRVQPGQELRLRYSLGGDPIERLRGCELVAYELDHAGRPVRVTARAEDIGPKGCAGEPFVVAESIEYLPFGPVSAIERPSSRDEYDHDLRYRMEAQRSYSEGSPLPDVVDRSYSYNGAGNLTWVTDKLQPARDGTFSYDDLSRLADVEASSSSLGPIHYEHDDIGNRTLMTVGIGKSMPITEYLYEEYVGATTSLLDEVRVSTPGGPVIPYDITHDTVGNLIDDDETTYAYNPRNQMVARGPLSFRYDAEGRRAWTGSSAKGEAEVFHLLLPDGQPATDLYGEDGLPPLDHWTHIHIGDRLLARFDERGNLENVVSDHIGYPLTVLDDGGAVLWDAEAEPYGEVVAVHEGSSTHDPLRRYPGQWLPDPDHFGGGAPTRLFYNMYRWYRPGWGRYTQSDPLGIVELNPYAYVGNNPVNDIDPEGEASCLWWLYKCASRERDCSDFWRGEIACMTLEERVDLFQRAEENAGKPINSEFAFLLWFCHETLPECQKMWDSCPRFILKPTRHRPQPGR